VAAGSDDNRVSGWVISTSASASVDNIRYYSLGTSGGGSYQSGGAAGADGSALTLTSTHYDAAYDIVRKQVDLFNILVLPRAAENRTLVDDLWANASIFAQERRALLLMEAPEDWEGVQTPSNEIVGLRVGVSKQYAALYYPRLEIREGSLTVPISPVGAVAGVIARTDTTVGVWKAPAGTAADVRGIVGVKQRLSDLQNGAINPKGINAIRALPDGVVVWGSRTMDGYDEAGSEYKYVPVRRVANYIEESLYRGLRWVVFEPNDEPLWAQIRLNVGAFMHDLFRKGAFQGTKPADAYFVKCDRETTTRTDQNLGIVNIWVGFAPLKPAEFVVVSLQQMAGQSEV
jgi:phage tail sheath protein FI